jgi:hypothetical protein
MRVRGFGCFVPQKIRNFAYLIYRNRKKPSEISAASRSSRPILPELQMTKSGRFFVDLETLISDQATEKQTEVEPGNTALLVGQCPEIRTTDSPQAGEPGGKIHPIVEAAISAPSGGNCQPWKWIAPKGSKLSGFATIAVGPESSEILLFRLAYADVASARALRGSVADVLSLHAVR